MFNESLKNFYTISFDSLYTDRKNVNDELGFHVDIGSAQNINSPIYLIAGHQNLARLHVPNEANIIAISDNLVVRKLFVEIDGYTYPKDGFITNYAENEYIDPCRDLIFY